MPRATPKVTPAQRSLSNRINAHLSWAKTPDRDARSAPGRAAAAARFERLVDPEGVLPEPERRKRAESLKKAHYLGLAKKSATARARASMSNKSAAPRRAAG